MTNGTNSSPTWSYLERGLAGLVAAVTVSLLGYLTTEVQGIRAELVELRGEIGVRTALEQRSREDLQSARSDIDALRLSVAALSSNVQLLSRELRTLRIE